MSLTTQEFENSDALVAEFSQTIAEQLRECIASNDSASLMVSGGSTPLPLFKKLSEQVLDWSKVTISLVDDRWVDVNDEASNEKLVRNNLLQNEASLAKFISLKSDDTEAFDAVSTVSKRFDDISLPFDIVILGMGEDGHTASLFPCSEQIELGLSTDALLIATQPTTAPYQRMSLSLKSIVQTQHLYLHLVGKKKLEVLNEAISKHTAIEKPIKAVCDATELTLMWAP